MREPSAEGAPRHRHRGLEHAHVPYAEGPPWAWIWSSGYSASCGSATRSWPPQIFLFMPDGHPVHETVGFMLPAQVLTEIEYALAKGALKSGDHERACRRLREFSEKYPEHERTAEARFWLGLSEWRRTDSFATSAAIWKDLIARWPKTTWAARVRWEVE